MRSGRGNILSYDFEHLAERGKRSPFILSTKGRRGGKGKETACTAVLGQKKEGNSSVCGKKKRHLGKGEESRSGPKKKKGGKNRHYARGKSRRPANPTAGREKGLVQFLKRKGNEVKKKKDLPREKKSVKLNIAAEKSESRKREEERKRTPGPLRREDDQPRSPAKEGRGNFQRSWGKKNRFSREKKKKNHVPMRKKKKGGKGRK